MSSDFHISYEMINSYVPEESLFETSEEWYEAAVDEIKSISRRYDDETGLRNTFPGWISGIKDTLRNSIEHRFNNPQGQWRIFDKIIGEYRISVDDQKVMMNKRAALNRMIDIFNSLPALTTKDPNPSKSKEAIIEGSDLELPEILERAIIYSTVKQKGKLALGGIMGYISLNHPELKSSLKDIVPEIRSRLEINLEKIENEGWDEYQERYDKIFGDAVEASQKEPEEINIEYFFGVGDYDPEVVFYEINGQEEGSIKIGNLIRKVKEDRVKNELNEIRPNGPKWPRSASGNYTVVISNGACALATKSTGRPWAQSSCERMNGPYPRGPYSDIKYGNCIAYIFEGDKVPEGFPSVYDDTLLGRTLMRWGNADQTDRVVVGLENRIYPSDRDRGPKLAHAIMLILQDNGMLDYTTCTTPYNYMGWGDTQGGHNKRLTYRLDTLKVEGKKINIEDSLIGIELALASSPTISYSDVMRLSRSSNDVRVRRQLAQNPSVFLNMEALERLLRSRDLEITKFIASSAMAEPELLMAIAQQVYEDDIVTKEYYYDVMSKSPNSLISTILKNPNTPPEAHRYLLDNHPGYDYGWELKHAHPFIGKNWDFMYVLMHYFGYDGMGYFIGRDTFMCPAPAEMMEELIDFSSLILKEPKGYFAMSENRIMYGNSDIVKSRRKINLERDSMSAEPMAFAFYSQMMTYLLYAPHLNLYNYKKIIETYYDKIRRRSKTLLAEEGQTVFNTLTYIKKMLNNIVISFAVPMGEVDDWGFKNNPYSGLVIPSGYVGKEWKLIATNFERQHEDILHTIFSNQNNYMKFFNETESLWIGSLIMENIRKVSCADYLWYMREEYNIPPTEFFYKSRDSKNPLEPTTRSVINDALLTEAFDNCTFDQKTKLKYDFIGGVERSKEVRTLRKQMPRNLTNAILSDVELCRAIGLDVVALWLVEPQNHFERFESILLKLALRDLWEEGEFLPPPEDLMDLFESTEDFHVLELAAIGDGAETGLVRNPRLPPFFQKSLLEDWVTIANKYEGGYGQLMTAIEEPLCLNPNTTEEYLNIFAQKQGLERLVAQNTNASQRILGGRKAQGTRTSLYHKYPVEVLSNAGLSSVSFDNLWDRTMDILKTEVFVDAERLFNTFGVSNINEAVNLLQIQKGKSFRATIRSILDSHQWLEYWRGGSVKAGSFSNYSRKNLWLREDDAVGGITDYPIPVEGKKSVIVYYDSLKKENTQKNNKIIYIDSCDVEGSGSGQVLVKGNVLEWDEERQQYRLKPFEMLEDGDKFFEYILPENRGEDIPIYVLVYPSGEQRRYENRIEVEEIIQLWNQNDENEEEMSWENNVIEDMKSSPRWNKENIFLFTDVEPPNTEEVTVPEWRYTWTQDQLNKITSIYVQRKDATSLLLEWKNEPYEVQIEERGRKRTACRMDLNNIIITIDINNAWTENLVNFCVKDLLRNDAYLLYNCHNYPLTSKLLEATLNYDRESLESMSLTSRDIERAQSRILSFDSVPPSYIYEVYLTTTSENVLQQANLARLKNPIPYNEYYAQVTQHGD